MAVRCRIVVAVLTCVQPSDADPDIIVCNDDVATIYESRVVAGVRRAVLNSALSPFFNMTSCIARFYDMDGYVRSMPTAWRRSHEGGTAIETWTLWSCPSHP